MANFANPSFETNVAGWIAGKRPNDLSNLEFWVDASQESYSDNDAAGTATDKSGNGRNAVNTSGAGTPTFKTGIVNGSSVYRFVGAGTTFLQSGTFAWSQPSASFYVANETGGNYGYVLSVNDANNMRVSYIHNGSNWIETYAGASLRYTTADQETHKAYVQYWNGGTSLSMSDGAGTVGAAGAGNGSGVTLGRNGVSGDNLTGDIAELGVYSGGTLSAADRQSLNSYLGFKYNLPMAEGGTAVRDTSVGYAGSSSLKMVGIDADTPFYELVNPGNTNQFTLSCYAYIDGTAVTSANEAALYYNGTAQSTTYADQGSGWTKLSCTVTGVASAIKCGVVVKSTKTVYADSFDITENVSGKTTYRNAPMMGVG